MAQGLGVGVRGLDVERGDGPMWAVINGVTEVTASSAYVASYLEAHPECRPPEPPPARKKDLLDWMENPEGAPHNTDGFCPACSLPRGYSELCHGTQGSPSIAEPWMLTPLPPK